MDDLEHLALAALLHDLPELFERTATQLSAGARRMLDLARLADPALVAILAQAEAYAAPRPSARAPAAGQPLISIFSRVQARQPREPEPRYYRCAPLPSAGDSWPALFPAAAPDATDMAAHLRALADQLGWLDDALDAGAFEPLYAHTLALLQRYGWCLPNHSQDMTLFDHARLTGAIAACLYRYHQERLSAEAIRDGDADQRFCLLAGTLAGAQGYVLDIAASGAASLAQRLRGRSFYLSALADVLGQQIARRFGVPLGNLIMAFGRTFYLLIPNRDAAERIDGLRREIDGWLHEQFNGELAICLAHTCFAGAMFRPSTPGRPGFGALLAGLSLKLRREQRRPGHGILAGAAGWDEAAFVVRRDFGQSGVCAGCRKMPAGRPAGMCAQCERDLRLGGQLALARYLAYYSGQEGDGATAMPLGCAIRLLAPDELDRAGVPYLLAKLNDPDIRELAGHPGAFRYLASHVPAGADGAPIGSEALAALAQGRPLLGYLKADVDHVGILLAQGLRRDAGGYDGVAQVAALSRQLDLFFSGWVQHLLSRDPAYQHVYTIFSGGDDLFLAAPWDRAAALAIGLRESFDAFVGGNPDIALSAGVLFARARYPIARAARAAEDALELSKQHEWTDGQGLRRRGDQLTVLGNTFAWSQAPAIFARIERLQAQSQHLTSAFLHDLIEYGRLYRLWAEEGRVEALRYKALFAYNIARSMRRGDSELYRWADDVLQSLDGRRSSPTMQHLELIATYLLFARRAG